MSTQPHYSFWWRRMFGAVLFLAMAVTAHAADVSGLYADDGTTVEWKGARPLVSPSFHAVMRLEFDPQIAGHRTKQTSEVKVTHEGNGLEIEVYDREGEVIWRRSWNEGGDYVQRGEQLVLRFRPKPEADEETLLTLESVTEHGLLQVTARRLKPTLLGPVTEVIGIFLFHRLQ